MNKKPNIDDTPAALAYIIDKLGTIEEKVDGIEVQMHEGFASIRAEMRDLRTQISAIEKRLDALEEHHRNMRGFAKEIDELRAELTAIKKHLGLGNALA